MLDVGTYQTKSYTAYFYENKIVICTGIQSIRIMCMREYHHSTLEELKLDVLNGKVKGVSDLTNKEGKLIWESCTRPLQ